jgi:DNA-binding NarL/FixJ family response regulator
VAACAIVGLETNGTLIVQRTMAINRFTSKQYCVLASDIPRSENRIRNSCVAGDAAGAQLSMTAAITHLVIADDHPLFRDALRQAVASVIPGATIDEAGSFEDLTALLERGVEADLILLDLSMPGISGFSGLIYLRAQYPAIPVVIVSATDDGATIRRSLDFGASGFIPKRFGVDTLRDAILKVMDGDIWVPADTDLSAAVDPDMTRLRDRLVTLTPQQVRVLMMLSEGLLNKQIAYELGVSEATIKAHVSAILQKLGVESRTQAVIAAGKIAGNQWR